MLEEIKTKKELNENYTVNLIGDGLLQDQFLTKNFMAAKRKALKYYKEFREEYIEDGYVKIIKFDDIDISGEDVFSIGFDEEIKEIEIEVQ